MNGRSARRIAAHTEPNLRSDGVSVDVLQVSTTLRWIRRYLGQSLAASFAVTAAIGTLLSFTFITLRLELSAPTALPWSVLLGLIFGVTRLAVAVTTNPLSYRYLEHYIDSPFVFEPTPMPEVDVDRNIPDAVVRALEGWSLTRTISMHDPRAQPSPIFDLHHSPSGAVLASVSHATGSLALMTELVDGRILHTTDLIVPPHPSMVVNTVKGSPQEIAKAHTRLLALLGTLDITPVQTGVQVFANVMAAEHSAYADLGPVLGSLLNLDGRVSPNLSYGIDIDDLLERTLI